MRFNILNRLGLQNSNVPDFNIPDNTLNTPGNPFPQQIDPTAERLPIRSFLGTPVFSSVTLFPVPTGLRGGDLNLDDVSTGLFNEQNSFFDANERVQPVELQTVLFDVAMTRNIIKTPVQGFNGTVKEYVSDGDFTVTMNGIITDQQPDLFPEGDVVRLLRICNQQREIGVTSPLLNIVFGITHLVVESYSFPMTEGSQNVQHFTLNCVSDNPVQLRIQQEGDDRQGSVLA